MAIITEAAFKLLIADYATALTEAYLDADGSGQMANELTSPSHPLRKIKKLFNFDAATGIVSTNTNYIDEAYLGKAPSKDNPFDLIANPSFLPPPPLSALCPGDLTIPGGSSQPSIDAVWAQWLSGFGIDDPGCPPVTETLTSVPPGLPIPQAGPGGDTTVTNLVEDDCGQSDSCQSTFSVDPG